MPNNTIAGSRGPEGHAFCVCSVLVSQIRWWETLGPCRSLEIQPIGCFGRVSRSNSEGLKCIFSSFNRRRMCSLEGSLQAWDLKRILVFVEDFPGITPPPPCVSPVSCLALIPSTCVSLSPPVYLGESAPFVCQTLSSLPRRVFASLILDSDFICF